jgi:hypothetical protein
VVDEKSGHKFPLKFKGTTANQRECKNIYVSVCSVFSVLKLRRVVGVILTYFDRPLADRREAD